LEKKEGTERERVISFLPPPKKKLTINERHEREREEK